MSEDANAGASEELFKFANLLYSYGQYREAQVKYTEFLAAHPNSPNVEKAWYQMGDCYLNLDQFNNAKQCFDNVISKWPNGKYAPPAAYRMAELTFNRSDFKTSVPYLRTAIKGFSRPSLQADPQFRKLQLEAQFFLAHALQMMGSNTEAIQEYEKVMASKEKTPYRERAQLDLAKLLLDRGESEKALVHFTVLANGAQDAAIKDEARFKAGILKLSGEDRSTATAFLRQTLQQSKNPKFKSEAQVALMLQAWEDSRYQDVIDFYGLAPISTTGPARADLEMMLAHSYRHLKKYELAVTAYQNVDRNYPGTKQATEAGYRVLQCYYLSGDKGLVSAVDRYVTAQSQRDPEVHYIDLALLLKAELLYTKGDFASAAIAFKNVRTKNIEERYIPARLYKMGWALVKSDNLAEGLKVLTEFVSTFPNHELVASALAQRGYTHQQMGNQDAALKDFLIIADKHPNFQNAEYVLRSIALIYAEQRKWQRTVNAYQDLLKRFPNTAVKAEANYWIGRGYFSLREDRKAIAPLEQARKLDPQEYGEKASLSIVIAYFNLRKEDGVFDSLLNETNAFLKRGSALPVPSEVFVYLGQTLYEKKDLTQAERFLLMVADYSAPLKTERQVWDMLSQVRLQKKDYQRAVTDLANYLKHPPVSSQVRARAQLDKAHCHLKIAAAADSQQSEGAKVKVTHLSDAKLEAEKVINSIRRGSQNSEARIIIGDVAMARGNPKEAAESYVIVCEFGTDPKLVPQALAKIIKALDAQGSPSDEYRAELKRRFPNYQAP